MRTKILAGILLATVIGVGVYFNRGEAVAFAPSSSDIELAKYKERELQDEKLGQYSINMMYSTAGGLKLSAAKKQILARAIVRIANDIFDDQENKRAFVAVLAIESQFDKFAQSPTGPKGLAQLTKNTFKEAMGECGVTELNEEDVWETDLNLYAGACYFKKLLENYKGDPYMAIVAYNQGPNSDSAKTFSKSGYMTELEPLKYVARFTFLKRTVTDEKQPNVPSIGDLPNPGSRLKASN